MERTGSTITDEEWNRRKNNVLIYFNQKKKQFYKWSAVFAIVGIYCAVVSFFLGFKSILGIVFGIVCTFSFIGCGKILFGVIPKINNEAKEACSSLKNLKRIEYKIKLEKKKNYQIQESICCPECGIEVSANAAICCNCGYPFEKEEGNNINVEKSQNIMNISNSVKKDLIICPECGKEILSESEICNNCGYPLQVEINEIILNESEMSINIEDKCILDEEVIEKDNISANKDTQRNFSTIIIGISALIIMILVALLLFSKEKNSLEEVTGIEQLNSNQQLFQTSKENLKPYIDMMGTEVSFGNLDVSQTFIDNIDSVYFLGRIGSITHGYNTYDDKQIIDIMDWESKETVSKTDFYDFVEILSQYYDYEAIEKSYENISDESYLWVDYSELCIVIGWYEEEKIHIRWDLEEELVNSISKTSDETNKEKNYSSSNSKLYSS